MAAKKSKAPGKAEGKKQQQPKPQESQQQPAGLASLTPEQRERIVAVIDSLERNEKARAELTAQLIAKLRPESAQEQPPVPSVTPRKPESESEAAISAIEEAVSTATALLVEEIGRLNSNEGGFRNILENGGCGDLYVGPYLWRALLDFHHAFKMLAQAANGAQVERLNEGRDEREAPIPDSHMIEELYRCLI